MYGVSSQWMVFPPFIVHGIFSERYRLLSSGIKAWVYVCSMIWLLACHDRTAARVAPVTWVSWWWGLQRRRLRAACPNVSARSGCRLGRRWIGTCAGEDYLEHRSNGVGDRSWWKSVMWQATLLYYDQKGLPQNQRWGLLSNILQSGEPSFVSSL